MNPFTYGTNLYTIIEDGWSRGLPLKQVHEECSSMGYFLKCEDIEKFIKLFESRYLLDMEVQELHYD